MIASRNTVSNFGERRKKFTPGQMIFVISSLGWGGGICCRTLFTASLIRRWERPALEAPELSSLQKMLLCKQQLRKMMDVFPLGEKLVVFLVFLRFVTFHKPRLKMQWMALFLLHSNEYSQYVRKICYNRTWDEKQSAWRLGKVIMTSYSTNALKWHLIFSF